jgi:hypothetical protein
MYHIGHFSSCDFVRHNVRDADDFRRLLSAPYNGQNILGITILLTTDVISQYVCVILQIRGHIYVLHTFIL